MYPGEIYGNYMETMKRMISSHMSTSIGRVVNVMSLL